MKHSEFNVGEVFYTANGVMKWKCTDIGKRWIIAARLAPKDVQVADDLRENVIFYEYDLPGCQKRGPGKKR